MLRIAFVLTALTVLTVTASADEPKKLAFLVGVDKYQKDGLADLNFADDDAEKLAEVLKGLGFEVDVLLRNEATGAVIRERFAKFIERTKTLSKQDVVLVSMSGHGIEREIQRDGRLVAEPFYCPYDALKSETSSLISLSQIMQDLVEYSGSSKNLLLIDACREDPTRGSKGLDGGTVKELPAKLSMLFACSSGQRSFESSKVKHGVFTYLLIEGLQGKARDENGEITWLDLASYVQKNVPRRLNELLDDEFAVQRPNLLGNLEYVPVLARIEAPSIPATGKPGETITNSIGMKLILIPPGEFLMGSPDSDPDALDSEKPQHRVRITKPFYLGQTEVTQAQWKAVMSTSPWGGQDNVNEGPDYPATHVSHDDAKEFCRKLSAKEGKTYRLPTEAEWEYACRAGTSTKYHFGNDASLLRDYAWIEDNADKIGEEYAHQVGRKLPNAWGLYDMHGNVWEWCYDWYDAEFYKTSEVDDPWGPSASSFRVLRGGSWGNTPFLCRSAYRLNNPPSNRNFDTGFRVVRVP